MKVCIVLTQRFEIKKGGSELQALFLSRELAKKGVTVSYVHFGNETNTVPINYKGVDYYTIKKPFFNLQLFNYFNFCNIENLIDTIKPDVVYQRGVNLGTIFLDICKKKSIKFFLHITKDDQCVPSKDKLSFIFSNKENSRIRLIFNSRIIVQSEQQKNYLKSSFGVKSRVLKNVYSFSHNEEVRGKSPFILWVANIKSWKRPHLFLDLADSFRKTNLKFLMVGRLQKDNYSSSIVRRLKKSSNVKYLGELEYLDVNKLFSKSLIFVNTSLPFEGFPNTFLQAWAHKTALITLDFDPDNIVKENNLGLHSNDFEKLVKDVNHLIKNNDYRIMQVDKSKEYIKNHHNLSKNTDLLLDLMTEG